VTFEEGTSAAWLHDLLKPHVTHLVVCDPRKNALLKDGKKSDRGAVVAPDVEDERLVQLSFLLNVRPVSA
jgi:hypothetical protein